MKHIKRFNENKESVLNEGFVTTTIVLVTALFISEKLTKDKKSEDIIKDIFLGYGQTFNEFCKFIKLFGYNYDENILKSDIENIFTKASDLLKKI
tara:strand:+ start:2954 stop:3238 length:285 start_codon:yes stop_codon:yes gene_type:complete